MEYSLNLPPKTSASVIGRPSPFAFFQESLPTTGALLAQCQAADTQLATFCNATFLYAVAMAYGRPVTAREAESLVERRLWQDEEYDDLLTMYPVKILEYPKWCARKGCDGHLELETFGDYGIEEGEVLNIPALAVKAQVCRFCLAGDFTLLTHCAVSNMQLRSGDLALG